ncbi:MAG: hypothetical protein AAF632_18615 [Bacteroidota bacterium]
MMRNTIQHIESFQNTKGAPAFYVATNQENQQFITSHIHPSANKTAWQAISTRQYESIKKEVDSEKMSLTKRPSSYYIKLDDGREVGLPIKSNHPAYEAAREAQYYLQDRERHSGTTQETTQLMKSLQKGLEKPVAGIHRGRSPVAVQNTEIKNTLDASFVQALRQSSRLMKQDYLEAMQREKNANQAYVNRSSSLSEAGIKTYLTDHERNEFTMKNGHKASYNIGRIEQISSIVNGQHQDQLPLPATSKKEEVLDQAYRNMWQKRQHVAPSTIQQLRKELEQDPFLTNAAVAGTPVAGIHRGRGPVDHNQDTTQYQDKRARIETMGNKTLQSNELVEHYYLHRKQGKTHDIALNEVASHLTKNVSITSEPNRYQEIVLGKQDHHQLSHRNYQEVTRQFKTIETMHQSVDHASGVQRLISSKDRRLDRAISITSTLKTTVEPSNQAKPGWKQHTTDHASSLSDGYKKLLSKIDRDQRIVKHQRLEALNTEFATSPGLSMESSTQQKGRSEPSTQHTELRKSYPNLSEEKISRFASMIDKKSNQSLPPSNQVEIEAGL